MAVLGLDGGTVVAVVYAVVTVVVFAIARSVFTLWRKWDVLKAIPSFAPLGIVSGHLGVIQSGMAHDLIRDKAKELGPAYLLRIYHQPFIIVTDPVEIIRISCRGDGFIDKAGQVYAAVNWVHEPYTDNILSSESDETWKALRKSISPCFTSSLVKNALPVISDCLDIVSDHLRAAGPLAEFNMNDISRRVILDTIGRWGFMTSWTASDLSADFKLVGMTDSVLDAVHQLFTDPWWKIRALYEPSAKTHQANCREFDAHMEVFSLSLKERLKKGELPETCLGGALLRTIDPTSKKPMDGVKLRSNVSLLVIAGYETTANALTATLLLLANHPEVLVKIEAELASLGLLHDSKQKKATRPLEWSDLGRLTYLNAVIKESLRIRPPISQGTCRMTVKACKICGYDVPPGTIISLPPYALDQSEAVYGKDAREYKPERWLEQKGSDWEGTGLFDDTTSGTDQKASSDRIKEPFAFSMGPRDCVGQALARMEMQVFLATLLSRFRLALAPRMGTPAEALDAMRYHLSLSMPGGLWMTAQPR